MDENFQSQTKLTEFAPLVQEEKEQGVGHLISKIFKFGKNALTGEPSGSQENPMPNDNVSQESFSSWSSVDINATNSASNIDSSQMYNEGRNLPNVLKRISNLLALKSSNLQAYGDTELKQYWMPDSVSRECYECCEKFTVYRRRHHCRVCGQIFCSQCCKLKIPGKIVGCTGDLRACTYCCKVVLAYLQSPEVSAHLTSDLKAFQEDLQCKFANDAEYLQQSITSINSSSDINDTKSLRRKISLGYQEEKFALGRASSTSYLSTEERINALKNSVSLRNLYEDLCSQSVGIILQTHRYRWSNYPNTLLGSELVDWLIAQRKANIRIQASAIGQALLEAGYLKCITEQTNFIDGWALYKLLPPTEEMAEPEQKIDSHTQDEPTWMQQIPHQSNSTDFESDILSPCTEKCRLPSSSSSYLLDLNFEESTVHLTRPPFYEKSEQDLSERETRITNVVPVDVPIVKTSQHREFVPETGWYNAINLRDDNGEREAYELLTNAYKQLEVNLLNQQLSIYSLSLNWRDIILQLIHEIVNKIRPDLTHDAEYLDIRNYIHFKKISGETSLECNLVEGIVCTKYIAHRGMASRIDNPKILLLNCSLVYQRTEGRLMSLEPVMLQEHEYLRNVAARIVALKPNLVLVHRNVSRLAQDLLREHKITLILNVKLSVLERLARCTDADLVTSIDAQLGRTKLGTCKQFHLKTFNNKTKFKKSLMFFEGLPLPHLGATVLLKGASKSELKRLKEVVATLIFAAYNWRLEKSYLMDAFAQPPNPKSDTFFTDDSSKENSPDINEKLELKDKDVSDNTEVKVHENNEQEQITKNKSTSDEKKLPTEVVKDFNDPLHLILKKEDDVFLSNNQEFSVSELPFSSKFRKALNDTVLSISPYQVFYVPYLETDIGRKCKLRSFFPKHIYYSEKFLEKSESVISKTFKDNNDFVRNANIIEKLNPPHPFVLASITAKISEDYEIQKLLANYRACGGRLTCRQLKYNNEENESGKQDSQIKNTQKLIDVLDLQNHQRLTVLFCSFSHVSNNAPAFCVDPWVVNMYYYGTDDIPLGCFLERFCFRSSYVCPSETCETPMLQHVRRFVHNSGCVSLSLNSFESHFKEEDIVMWSWCTKCSAVSPVVPMSSDTWSFSLAKYLEQRFHGHIYSRRGNEACSHSLHRDHYQYFGYKNVVASFKYSVINQWEVSLPPPLIQISYDTSNQQAEIINEIKSLALRGHEIFSTILEKLSGLAHEGDEVNVLKQQLQKEHLIFKGKVEEVQLKLTSPTLEDKKLNDQPEIDLRSVLWPLEDLIVQLKRIMAETVDTWNTRLIGSTKKDSEKRKDTKQQQSYVDDKDVSENECTDNENLQKSESISSNEATTSTNIICKKNRSLDHGDMSDDSIPINCSPKGHCRSQSDGTVMAQNDDSFDIKKEQTDKKSVKTILSQLLQSVHGISPLQNPFGPQEHHLLPIIFIPIVVYENEPGSIIAYALTTYDYKRAIDELTLKRVSSVEQSPSPVHKRKNLSASDRSNSDLNVSSEKHSSLLSFLWTTQKTDAPLNSPVFSTGDMSENEDSTVNREKIDDSKKSKPPCIEVEFQDTHCNFCCRVYYAEKFVWLRSKVLPAGEEAYVRSLRRSVQWNARGGKSGSLFSKTKDNRFILKEMTKQELQQFLDSANNYFAYMERCLSLKLPTLLGKIVGVYQILYRNITTNANLRMNLLVIENLFYERTVTHKFDLKGSMRNRLVNPDDQEGEIVLLDENLLKRTCESPLYIYPHSKSVLTAAIQNDTKFLSSQKVMDYSLLVGLDEDTQELVVGIIDYIRTFTWDKKLEHMVKKAGMLGGQGKTPTIVSPENYRDRFIAAMHRYFLQVPDRWTGFGKPLEY